MRFVALLLIGSFVLIPGFCLKAMAEDGGFGAMKGLVRSRFPKVPQLSTTDLAAWLKDKSRKSPILLDVRTPEEYRVSHLAGAVRVDPSAKAADLLPLLHSDRPIVTYCSVGYRSSAVAERLMKAGVSNIHNLEGSIFQWANEGRPLEVDGKPQTKVHPYNSKYGKMLDESKRAAVK